METIRVVTISADNDIHWTVNSRRPTWELVLNIYQDAPA